MKQGDVTTQDEAVLLPAAFQGTFNRDLTIASGNQSITGVGFRPSSIIVYAATLFTSPPIMSWGQGGDNGAGGIADRSLFQKFNEDYDVGSLTMNYQGDGPLTRYSANLISFDADGFTLTWTKSGATTGTLVHVFLAFK